jgi:hypothetical protein
MRRSATFVLVMLAPLAARAEDAAQTERAQALFNVGAQAYAQGEFKGAIDAFEEAYRASPRPGVQFSIAQAHRKQFYALRDPADLRVAMDQYRAYIAKVSSGKYRVMAVDALGELEAVASKMGIAANATVEATIEKRTRVMVSSAVDGARVALDDGAFKSSPLIADVTPGKHSVRVEAEGYFSDARPLVAVEGGLVALDVPLRERAAQLLVHADSGSDIIVDRRPVGRTPLTAAIELPAGPHVVAVTHNGRRPYSESIRLARGETRTLSVDLASTSQRVVSFALLTTAGAALVAGGVFVGLAFYEQGQAEQTQAAALKGTITQSQLDGENAAIASRETFKVAAYCALGGAVALTFTAFGLLLFDTPRAPLEHQEMPTPLGPTHERGSPLEVSATPLLGPGLVGASLIGRF